MMTSDFMLAQPSSTHFQSQELDQPLFYVGIVSPDQYYQEVTLLTNQQW